MLIHHAIKRMHCTPMKASMMHQAMAVLGLGSNFGALRAVLIDSGCTKSVFRNKDKLINLRTPAHNYIIHGVGGKLPVTLVGDFPVALKHKSGKVTVRLIKECLYAPDASANLLATGDLQEAGIGLHIPADNSTAAHLFVADDKGEKLMFNLAEHKGIYLLPFHQDCMTHFAGAASHQFRALTEVELWHLRLGHAGTRKIAKLSRHCKGIPKPLADQELPCHMCQEGKSKRQNYPAASEN
jgi:hypothetical protein